MAWLISVDEALEYLATGVEWADGLVWVETEAVLMDLPDTTRGISRGAFSCRAETAAARASRSGEPFS